MYKPNCLNYFKIIFDLRILLIYQSIYTERKNLQVNRNILTLEFSHDKKNITKKKLSSITLRMHGIVSSKYRRDFQTLLDYTS